MDYAKLLVMTGVAPHSLGETSVKRFFDYQSESKIIGIDHTRNHYLDEIKNYIGLEIDLNPLIFPKGFREFSKSLHDKLIWALEQTNRDGVECLIQSAGVYDYGTFLEHNVSRRNRILGVNLLGQVEVLHAIMVVNQDRGIDNSKTFTYVNVGSFQGLYARANRALYASSKSVGIDFCTSLEEGKEVSRIIYFAPGPIDTHMLHKKHWITTANGSSKFFYQVFEGPPDQYKKIFVRCDETALREASADLGCDTEGLLRKFERYNSARKKLLIKPPGILRRKDCADILAKIIFQPDIYKSGIYVATADSDQLCVVKTVQFHELSRQNLFEKLARPIDLP